jgi:hypothetical protein
MPENARDGDPGRMTPGLTMLCAALIGLGIHIRRMDDMRGLLQ